MILFTYAYSTLISCEQWSTLDLRYDIYIRNDALLLPNGVFVEEGPDI